jgi:hypothetical protein
MDGVGLPSCDQSIEPNIPNPAAAATSSIRFALIGFMAISSYRQRRQLFPAMDDWVDLHQGAPWSFNIRARTGDGTNCIVKWTVPLPFYPENKRRVLQFRDRPSAVGQLCSQVELECRHNRRNKFIGRPIPSEAEEGERYEKVFAGHCWFDCTRHVRSGAGR